MSIKWGKSQLASFPSLSEVIGKIEKDGNYRVTVKDCSLGKNFPVVATIITDVRKGTFGVKFASHPYFPVAVERTLTEAFQGYNLETFTSLCRIGSREEVAHRHNVVNIMKIGMGIYPASFLAGTPDYEFGSFDFNAISSNREMLKKVLSLVKKEGFPVYIHDASYLGFKSYHIVVPGMSELYPVDFLKLRENNSSYRTYDIFSRLHSISDEEAECVANLFQFKEGSMLENEISMLTGHLITDKFPGGRSYESSRLLAAMCHYHLGRFSEAKQEMKRVSEHFERYGSLQEKVFYRCMAGFVSLRAAGYEKEFCGELLSRLYDGETAERVSYLLSDEKKAIEKFYPKPVCYDCSTCELNKKGMCSYAIYSDAIRKIKDAMKKNVPDQKKLQQDVREVINYAHRTI